MAMPLLTIVAVCVLVVSIGANTVNFTVYRITPRNYTGIADFDTGIQQCLHKHCCKI